MEYIKQEWNKQTWKKGQENFQSMLNHIEDGIANAGQGGSDASIWEQGEGEHSIQSKDAQCVASGDYSFAIGYGSHAQANYSKASGFICRALKDDGDNIDARYARADGYMTDAGGIASSTDGDTTHTQNIAEHAQGRGNVSHKDSNNFGSSGNTIHSIGIASNNQDILTFKNALEVMQNGDVYILGIGDYNGKDITGSQTLQTIIENSSNGLYTVIKDADLTCYGNFFSGSFESALLPSDFSTPGKYNLIVVIMGIDVDSTDDPIIYTTYTANHFQSKIFTYEIEGQPTTYLISNCTDSISVDDVLITHNISVKSTEDGAYIDVDYEGRKDENNIIKENDAKFSLYLQRLF